MLCKFGISVASMGAVGKYLNKTLSGGRGRGASKGLLPHSASSALQQRGKIGFSDRASAFPDNSVERECFELDHLGKKCPQGQE